MKGRKPARSHALAGFLFLWRGVGCDYRRPNGDATAISDSSNGPAGWFCGQVTPSHRRRVMELAPPDDAANPTTQRKRRTMKRRDPYESPPSRMKVRLRVRDVSMRKRVTS